MKGKNLPAYAPPEREPELRITIPAGHKLAERLHGLRLGQKITLEVTGKVCSARADKYESHACLDIKALEVSKGLGDQLEDLRESRRG